MSRVQKCLIVNSHFRPLIGGALTVYEGLATARPDVFHILSATVDYTTGRVCDGAEVYDTAVPFAVHRLEHLRAPMRSGKGFGVLTAASRTIQEWRVRKIVLREILNLQARHDFDVICIGALDALGWLVGPLKAQTRALITIYTHGEDVSQTPYRQAVLAARGKALAEADGIVAVSNFTAQLIVKKFALSPGKIKMLKNGVDLLRFKQKPVENVRVPLGIGAGPLVLSVGRLVERKGFDKLLEAWPRVLAAVPEAKLAIAGTGVMTDRLRGLADADDMQDSVRLLGHVPDALLPSLYATSDLFVMPNRTMPDGDTEGFGLVFLEAAASGVPAIGGRAGGVEDAILDGETGLLIDGGDIGAIAFAITDLLADDVRRAAMAEAGRAHALTQGWPDKADELLCFFEALSHKNGA